MAGQLPMAVPYRRIELADLERDVASILREVRHGTAFGITSKDEVIAEIRPVSASRPVRRPGALRGRIAMHADFDSLPPDMLAAMGGALE